MRTPFSFVSNYSTLLFISAATASLALLGAGCGKATPAVVNTDATFHITDQAGNSLTTGEGSQAPADLPADLPKYPGATTKLALNNASDHSASLVQDTADTLDQVQTKIELEMKAAGFTKDQSITQADLIILSFAKANVRIQVMITHTTSGTEMQVTRTESAS